MTQHQYDKQDITYTTVTEKKCIKKSINLCVILRSRVRYLSPTTSPHIYIAAAM